MSEDNLSEPAESQEDQQPEATDDKPAKSAGLFGDTADLGDIVDELPDDLDPTVFVGPRTFPNNNRRRIPAALYLVIGVAMILLWAAMEDTSPALNSGSLWAGIGLVAFALYGMIAGRNLAVDESDALVTATAKVGFPVGHSAAQMVWRGWLSKPTWRVLLYSAENPPKTRGIVLVDGSKGDVLEWFVEENPEDWASFDPTTAVRTESTS